MKKVLCLCVLILGAISLQAQTPQKEEANPREFVMKEGDTTFVMKEYYLLIYLRGEKSLEFTEDQLKEIQSQHMAHINKLAEAGQVHLAGPFGDDTDKRGILVFDVESLDKAKELAGEDPAVKAGRLSFEIHPWWAAKGSTLR